MAISIPHLIFLIILMSTSSALKIAVLTGSTRTSGPPRPIIGPRVCTFLQQAVLQRGHIITTTLHPRKLPHLEKPHFSYASSQVPEDLAKMHDALAEADAYITITPEFNHGPSPGLLNTLNHFGSSVFGYKPSLIVSYSPSQWGGVRAAHSLRPILSELGCLPVSSMIHFPRAHQVLGEDGSIVVDNDADDTDWNKYIGRSLSQLEWWAEAAKEQRQRQDPYESAPAFTKTPNQRNAPS